MHTKKKSQWSLFYIVLIWLVIAIQLAKDSFLKALKDYQSFKEQEVSYFRPLLENSLGSFLGLLLIGQLIARSAATLTTNFDSQLRYMRIRTILMSLVIGGAGVLVTIKDQEFKEIYLIIIVMFFVFRVMPDFFTFWKPEIAYNPFVAIMYDAFFVLTGLVLEFQWITSLNSANLWLALPFGFYGGILIYGGIRYLQSGRSLHRALKLYYPNGIDYLNKENAYWKIWINRNIPEEEQQRNVKKILEDKYPPSKTRSFINMLMVGVGGWLILTVIQSVIGWFVENWLDSLNWF